MKIKEAYILYIPLFVIVILLQLYLSSFRLNIIIQMGVIGFLFFLNNKIFSKKFLNQLVPFIFLFLFGFIGTLLHKYDFIDVIKDNFHFIKPIVGLCIGYLIFRKINDFRLFVQVIVITGLISAFIHLFIVFFMTDFGSGSISRIRLFTKDNFLELFSIFFLLFYKKYAGRPLFPNTFYSLFILGVLLFSSMLYFSRTMIAMAIILTLSVYGYTQINKRVIVFAGVGVLSVVGLYIYLNNANIKRGASGIEGFLYKVKIAPEEIFSAQINRDNHRDLWDHWRAYEAKRAYALMKQQPSSFLVGTGHGSLVNLKFYAPLTGEQKGIRYISELHNGYMYVFYKTGAIGLLVYLFVMFRWYFYLYKNKKNFVAVFISAIGLIYMFSTLTITGLYNTRDIITFVLGGLLFFAKDITPVKTEKELI